MEDKFKDEFYCSPAGHEWERVLLDKIAKLEQQLVDTWERIKTKDGTIATMREQLAAANAKLEGRAIREEECECASAPIDNVCRCCATFLRNELKAANARIAEARALWESEIHYMIRPDSDDEVENASADKHIIAFEKVLGGGQCGTCKFGPRRSGDIYKGKGEKP